MNTEEQRYLTDKAVILALRQVYPSRILDYHPRNYQEAYDHQLSFGRENIGRGTTVPSEFGYDVPGELPEIEEPLDKSWDRIMFHLRRSPNEGWHTAELITVAYGCKNQHTNDSYEDLRVETWTWLIDRFNGTYIEPNYAFVDIAYEDCAEVDITGGAVIDGARVTELLFVVHRSSCHHPELPTNEYSSQLFN
nr:hypothetical protein B0A51_06928 [Rachicladosporium sp. CCFEE 5018]